jgi:hypothetical protein
MEIAIKEIATVLHSTDTMADRFAKRVQQRLGEPVSPAEILAAMKKVPSKSLTMNKVIAKLRRQRKEERQKKLKQQERQKKQEKLKRQKKKKK